MELRTYGQNGSRRLISGGVRRANAYKTLQRYGRMRGHVGSSAQAERLRVLPTDLPALIVSTDQNE